MSLTQEIASKVLPALATAVASLITLAAPVLIAQLVQRVQAKTTSDAIKAALGRLGDAAAKAVRATSAAIPELIGKDVPDGKFSPTERVLLRDDAIARVRQYLGPVNMTTICQTLGYGSVVEMTKALETEIENAVSGMKIQKLAATAATPVVPVTPV